MNLAKCWMLARHRSNRICSRLGNPMIGGGRGKGKGYVDNDKGGLKQKGRAIQCLKEQAVRRKRSI